MFVVHVLSRFLVFFNKITKQAGSKKVNIKSAETGSGHSSVSADSLNRKSWKDAELIQLSSYRQKTSEVWCSSETQKSKDVSFMKCSSEWRQNEVPAVEVQRVPRRAPRLSRFVSVETEPLTHYAESLHSGAAPGTGSLFRLQSWWHLNASQWNMNLQNKCFVLLLRIRSCFSAETSIFSSLVHYFSSPSSPPASHFFLLHHPLSPLPYIVKDG